MQEVNNQMSTNKQLSFKQGALKRAINHPPYPAPQNQKERDQNLLAMGIGAGMDIQSTFRNVASGLIIAGGAAFGAIHPRLVLNKLNTLVGNKGELIKHGEDILKKTRGKAALVSAAAVAGTAAILAFGVRTISGIIPSKKASVQQINKLLTVHPQIQY